MMKKLVSVLFVLSLVLGACQTASAPTEEPAVEEVVSVPSETPTAVPTSTPLPPPTKTPIPTPHPSERCKLPNTSSVDDVSLGFPVSKNRMPSTGTVQGVVLFAEFEDVKTTHTPEEVFAIISPDAEEFFTAISYGRIDLQLEPHLAWLMLSKPSTAYADGLNSHSGQRNHLQEAINLADDEVDFSEADVVIVMNNPRASALPKGPAWTGYYQVGGQESSGSTLLADGNEITNGTTSGYDLNLWGFLWLNHELGHSMGLADLYSYERYEMFTGPFTMMADIHAKAPEFAAYERWLLGWIDNDQVICQYDDEEQVVTLTPVETEGGVKTLIIRDKKSRTRAVVIESRRAIGYDSDLTTPGAVVYSIDTSVASGYGPLIAENNKRALTEGKSVTVGNVTITVLESTEEGDTIQVTLAE